MLVSNEKGVTLTEAVVTFVILGVLAMGFLTMIGVNANETRQGVANSRMQMQYDNIADQISRKARNAAYILAAGEDSSQITTYITDNTNVSEIRLFNATWNLVGKFKISGATLEEHDSVTNGYKAFKAGKDAVSLAPGSHFFLAKGRKEMLARLNLKYTYKHVTDTLQVKPYYIRCRN